MKAQVSCQYGVDQCGKNQACVQFYPDDARCMNLPAIAIDITFPMQAEYGAWCDQGPLSPIGNSHAFTNTSFALDLSSNRNHSAAKIIASSAGKVITYNKCKTQNDDCGGGFGNYVQILREDGVMLFYAHLDEVYFKTGDHVSPGQIIGLEGNTGWTGKENRHLHFSVHHDWRELGFDYLSKNVGHTPKSVPFNINACQPNQLNCGNKFIDVRKLKCTRVTNQIDWLFIQ